MSLFQGVGFLRHRGEQSRGSRSRCRRCINGLLNHFSNRGDRFTLAAHGSGTSKLRTLGLPVALFTTCPTHAAGNPRQELISAALSATFSFEPAATLASLAGATNWPETSRLLFGQQAIPGLQVAHQSLLQVRGFLKVALKLLLEGLNLQRILILYGQHGI